MNRLRNTLILLCAVAAPAQAQKILSEGVKDLASQISGSVAKQQKTRIAVVPFHELDGRTTVLGTYLAEELVTNLFNLGNVDIVERAMLDKIMAELKLSQTGAIDPDTAKQIGKVAGVDAIVTGSITDLQSFVGINCRLVDAQTGRIFAAAQTKIVKDDDVRKIMGAPVPGIAEDSESKSNESQQQKKVTNKKLPTYENAYARVSVHSVQKRGQTVTIVLVFESVRSDRVPIYVASMDLIDESGGRWGETEPSRNQYRRIDLVPGTRERRSYVFAVGDDSGARFTLAENGTDGMVMHGLVAK